MRRTAIAIASLAIFALPSAAMAACSPPRPQPNPAQDLAEQRAWAACLAQQLHDATAMKAQQLQLQSDLKALELDFDFQLKMQQSAAAVPVTPPLPAF